MAGQLRSILPPKSEQRARLGLAAENVGGKRPTTPRPTEAPVVLIKSIVGQTVKVVLRDPESIDRRAQPKGITMAVVWTATGDTPPRVVNGHWKHHLISGGEGTIHLNDPTIKPGTKLWVCAQWVSRSQLKGPLGRPTTGWLTDASIKWGNLAA
jgi:hypothetical protein